MFGTRRAASRGALLAAVLAGLAGLTGSLAAPAVADQTAGYSHDGGIGLTATGAGPIVAG